MVAILSVGSARTLMLRPRSGGATDLANAGKSMMELWSAATSACSKLAGSIPATGGGWWLFYSGNFFDRPEYATGLAYCPTLEGPCEEASDGPFLATADLGQERQFAPGGLETVVDADGTLWVVFDTWNRPPRDGRFRCCRSLQLAPVLSA